MTQLTLHPRPFKRRRLGALIAIGAGIPFLLCAAAAYWRPDLAARGAAGLTAHNLCSAVFVSHLEAPVTFGQAIAPLIGPPAPLVRYKINRDDKTVAASFAGLFGAKAEYVPGFGCRLADPANIVLRPAAGLQASGAPLVVNLTHDPSVTRALNAVFAERPATPAKRVKAVIVMRNGVIIAERYAEGFGPTTKLASWSVAKSFTNALTGVLVRQGRLATTQSDLAPEWTGDDARRRLTVEDLLRMQSGLDAPEEGSPTDAVTQMLFVRGDMAGFAASRPLGQPPRTAWDYTSANTLILDRLIGHRVGGGPAQLRRFAQQQLFDPLGMGEVIFEYDAAGTFVGSSYVYATARDYARFGGLYLADGLAPDGRRILPQGWVAWSRRATLGRGYGAGFWTNDGPGAAAAERVAAGFPADGFFASGIQGQRIYIVPSKSLVIVRFGYSSAPDFGLSDDIGLIAAAAKAP